MSLAGRPAMQLHRREADAKGWEVVDVALALADDAFGARLVAAYALGSLAHDGFAPGVSDVDVALILDRLDDGTGSLMDRIRTDARARLGTALSGRLSLFWSTWDGLRGIGELGRFPLTDRQDLAAHGICLRGVDRRENVVLPEPGTMKSALVVESAEFMLAKLATPDREELLRDPRRLASLGCREVTKAVLFPVRFLYTVDTGAVANNPTATDWFLQRVDGPVAVLVRAASAWRARGALDTEEQTVRTMEEGLLRLYLMLTTRYENALRMLGEPSLAQGLEAWRGRLVAALGPGAV